MNLSDYIQTDFTKITSKNLDKFKRVWSKSIGYTPKNSKILSEYRLLVKNKQIKPSLKFERLLQTRGVRSISGVTPFAVMMGPYTCPGQCTFCPLEAGMPKSYLSDEPAAQRAKKLNFDPYLQVKNRLKQLKDTGHNTDKIELIVIGGTFSAYPDEYKKEFFLGMYNAINNKSSKTIESAQIINQTAKHRIVGISIETRPDWLDEKEIILLRELGVTRLQIGVQTLDGKILKKVKRGHSIAPIAKATKNVKNAGFKVCYHYMPNLPGSNPKKDVAMAKKMFTDPRFKPDTVKIYPTQVIPKTPLYRQWQRGEFKTYDDATLKEVLKQIKLITPRYCRIDRLVRDISKKWIADGTVQTNMRQIIQNELRKEGKKCVCIRCREIKKGIYNETPKLVIEEIETSGGKEYLLTFEIKDHLYSLLRLRLPNKKTPPIFKELKNSAIIREIHTYGVVSAISAQEKTKTQHKGLGKKLIKEAEKIAKKEGYNKIAVISAIGTREYYKKFGYVLEGTYMTKLL